MSNCLICGKIADQPDSFHLSITQDIVTNFCNKHAYIGKNIINNKCGKEEETMNENYLMLNGKRVDLTDKQIEKLGLKVEENPFETSYTSKCYYIGIKGDVKRFDDWGKDVDNALYKVANYCTDKQLLQQRALHETLSRLLWRFSMQNDGEKIDWSDRYQEKYYISYDYYNEKIKIFACQTICIMETPWFISYAKAQRAIDEIVLPFMKEHPEFVW